MGEVLGANSGFEECARLGGSPRLWQRSAVVGRGGKSPPPKRLSVEECEVHNLQRNSMLDVLLYLKGAKAGLNTSRGGLN